MARGRRVALAAAALAAALLTTAAAPPALTASAYRHRLQRVAADLYRDIPATNLTHPDVLAAVRRAESRARALAAEVRRLRPPARFRAANRALADAIAAQAGELRALAASGRSPLVLRNEMGDTPALRRVRAILNRVGGVLKPSPSASLVPIWMRTLGLPRAARPGAVLFADVGCLACHTYAGTGSSNLGGKDLTAEAGRGRGTAWQSAHLRCPSCVVPGSPMPAFASLGAARVRALAAFLEASRGRR